MTEPLKGTYLNHIETSIDDYLNLEEYVEEHMSEEHTRSTSRPRWNSQGTLME